MTRFNLHEAALLDASGELSRKTSERLQEHLTKDLRARAQAEDIQAGFAILQSQVKPVVSGRQSAQISRELKTQVRREVRRLKREKNSAVRRRFFYGALAGVSAVAACLIITLSIVVVVRNQAQKREMAIVKAENSLRDFMNADADNITDTALASLDGQISKANALQEQWSPTESSGYRAKLLELVDPPEDDAKDTGT